MGEELMRFKVGEGKKAINVIVKTSNEKSTPEEDKRLLTEFVMWCYRNGIALMKKKIEEKTAFCHYCKKQILTMDDFFLHDKHDCCKECYEKINPSKKKRKSKKD